jgi:hypothetical protein
MKSNQHLAAAGGRDRRDPNASTSGGTPSGNKTNSANNSTTTSANNSTQQNAVVLVNTFEIGASRISERQKLLIRFVRDCVDVFYPAAYAVVIRELLNNDVAVRDVRLSEKLKLTQTWVGRILDDNITTK